MTTYLKAGFGKILNGWFVAMYLLSSSGKRATIGYFQYHAFRQSNVLTLSPILCTDFPVNTSDIRDVESHHV